MDAAVVTILVLECLDHIRGITDVVFPALGYPHFGVLLLLQEWRRGQVYISTTQLLGLVMMVLKSPYDWHSAVLLAWLI
jgi:hypothetical protein